MIRVRGLSKSFDGRPVLKGVSLDMGECETVVILGPSGQGKTVLIKTMIRLLEPDSGQVFYQDRDILTLSKREFRRVQENMAFVFQANALFDFLNVRDNLSLYLQMHKKMSPEEIATRVQAAIQFVGLDHTSLEKFPEELSGGMQKRVAIARAILQEPRVIFYDEPTVGLDEGNVEKVIDLIELLKKQVCATSVIVTHDISLMQRVADRVALLRHGEVVFTGTKEEVSADMLSRLYSTGVDDEH
ncbi:MAG: ATP-binding cassette domain-containing protein [Candidatus Aminicenantaceae bacterium]